MSTLSRIKIWVNGDVLTAADLNGEFNNILNDYNGSIGSVNIGTLTNTLTLTVAANSIALNTTSSSTTTNSVSITSDSLTSGGIIRAISNSADVTSRNLVNIINDNAAASGAVNLRVQQDSIGDMTQWFDGADLTAKIDDLGQFIGHVPFLGWNCNLGLGYGGNTLTIQGADGAALSATNPAFVCIGSTTVGRLISLRLAANITFTDGVAGQLVGNTFGITSAVNWANDMPFFLYAINFNNTDAGLAFAISRDPTKLVTPNPVYYNNQNTADAQGNFFCSIASGGNDLAAKPCICIGAFRMRWTGATTSWIVQALGSNDGIGKDKIEATCSTTYTMPLNQNGAAVGTHLIDNGGTAPVFNTNQYFYTIDKNGMCIVQVRLTGDGGGDGIGAVDAQCSLPYRVAISPTNIYLGETYVEYNGTERFCMNFLQTNQDYFQMYFLTALTTTAVISNDLFVNGTRTINTMFSYKAF